MKSGEIIRFLGKLFELDVRLASIQCMLIDFYQKK
jgi:hypothetical protein